MLQRWLRICWKWSTFWKACDKQNTWECWVCMGCNHQRSATDSERTRSWSGDSQNYCVQDCNAGSWHETCGGKIHSMSSVTRAEGTLCCSYYWLDSNHYQWTRFPQEGHKAQWSQWKSPGSPRPKKLWQKLQQDQDHVNCVLGLGRYYPSWAWPSRSNN